MDTKHEIKLPGFRVTDSVSSALADTPSIFRPHDGARGDYECRLLFDQVYRRWGYDLGIDELYALGGRNFNTYPEELIRLYTRGRSRGISVFGCTQRPVFCPKFAFTEPYHVFVFPLDEADAIHLAKSVGNRKLATPINGHRFIYYNKSDGTILEHELSRSEVHSGK